MKSFQKIALILLLVLGANQSFGQQLPVNSLYMFDMLLINPAYAGVHVQLSATGIYRNQWVNIDGAPKTFTGSLHSGFRGDRMGVGLILINDRIGVHDDNSVYVTYSYKIPLYNGAKISMGLQAGFDFLKSDYTITNPNNVNDPAYQAAPSENNPNFGAGLFYTYRGFYAGFSVPYILNSKSLNSYEGVISAARTVRNYYLTAGTTYNISENFKIIPSALMRVQDGAPFSFDFSANFIIKETVGLGATYRLGEGIIGLFELKINENFHIGYAYDATISDLRYVSNGSHEIMLNYRIRIPRLHSGLECPSYF